jgi:hypothetical protein
MPAQPVKPLRQDERAVSNTQAVAAAPAPVRPVRVGGSIKTPTKTKDVRPIYPPIAQSARVSGVVIVEATIDADGSVKDATVLRSIPLLDQAALEAIHTDIPRRCCHPRHHDAHCEFHAPISQLSTARGDAPKSALLVFGRSRRNRPRRANRRHEKRARVVGIGARTRHICRVTAKRRARELPIRSGGRLLPHDCGQAGERPRRAKPMPTEVTKVYSGKTRARCDRNVNYAGRRKQRS